MSWINLNMWFKAVADEQGVVPGTAAWNDGGIMPYSGTTGGHAAYGWKFDKKLASKGESYARAIIANYCHRPCYYLGCTGRHSDYDQGGRPWGYVPELPGDQPFVNFSGGGVHYQTPTGVVNVTGPDVLHFHIGPLVALFDSKDIKVKIFGQERRAEWLAGQVIQYIMTYLTDCLVTKTGLVESYHFTPRGTANIIESLCLAQERNLLLPADKVKAFAYILQTTIPTYKAAPDLNINGKGSNSSGMSPPFPTGYHYEQLYNQMFWLLPALYMLSKLFPHPELEYIITRYSQYILDLETLVPGKSAGVTGVSLPPELIQGGELPRNWIPHITAANVHIDSHMGGTELWGFRAQAVAAKVLESDVLLAANQALATKLKATAKLDDWNWLVNADGTYV